MCVFFSLVVVLLLIISFCSVHPVVVGIRFLTVCLSNTFNAHFE